MRYSHAIARARERYGLDLSDIDFDRMRRWILTRQPEVIPLGTDGGGAALLAIRYGRRPRVNGSQWIAVIWKDETIVTVLPRLAIVPYSKHLDRRKWSLVAAGRTRAWRSDEARKACQEVVMWAAHRTEAFA